MCASSIKGRIYQKLPKTLLKTLTPTPALPIELCPEKPNVCFVVEEFGQLHY